MPTTHTDRAPASRIEWPLGFASFSSGATDTLLVFFLPYHLFQDLHEQKLLVVGMSVALPQLGVLAASGIWGALGDKWRRLKPNMIVGLAGYAAMFAAMAAATTSGAVILAALLGSLLYAAYRPAAWSYVTLRRHGRSAH